MDSSFTAVKLNNGWTMPSVGLGTWLSEKEEMKTALRAALDAGYRHIDTAFAYKNENVIGEALQKYLKSGKVKREDLFIVTKLPAIHMDAQLVKRSIEMSLNKLQLDYLDLYLIHFPVPLEYDGNDDNIIPVNAEGKWKAAEKFDLLGTWKAMEELVDLNLTRSIGVSNFSVSQVKRICEVAKYKPVTNQVECHIYCQQKEMSEAMEKLGVSITAYSPIGAPGRLDFFLILIHRTNRVVSFHEKQGALRTYFNLDPYGKTGIHVYAANLKGFLVPSVLLRNLLQRGMSVIPKSTNPERIRSNIQVFDFSLTKPEMDEIAGITYSHRYLDVLAAMFPNHPERPW